MDHNREKKEKLAKNQQRVEENRGGIFEREKLRALCKWESIPLHFFLSSLLLFTFHGRFEILSIFIFLS